MFPPKVTKLTFFPKLANKALPILCCKVLPKTTKKMYLKKIL